MQNALDGYEVVSDEARIATETLIRVRERVFGSNQKITASELGESGWMFVEYVFKVWKDLFPQEYKDWVHDVLVDLKYEIPVERAVKNDTGYFSVSFHPRFYNMLSALLPDVNITDKSFVKRLVKKIPEAKTVSYNL